MILRGAALLLLGVAATGGCTGGGTPPGEGMRATGDPRQGAALIREFGCGSCHTIPGIRSAKGVVGPPLDFFSRRTYITGRLPNSEQNLVLWILNPQQVDPLTAMPPVGASENQARHIAAYLYTLE